MKKCIAAHTNPGADYPGFINFSREADGSVTVHFRGNPEVRENSSYICGFDRDKGKPGRCTPGDDRCNNYCNMAPEKGKMQEHPAPCRQTIEGKTGTLTLTAEAFAALIAEAANDGQ